MVRDLTRRALLSAAAAVVAPIDTAAAEQAPVSLAGTARRGGRFYGAAVRLPHLLDGAFSSALLTQSAVFTPELDLKWAAVEPQPGALALGPVDELADIAAAHGKAVYGHTLLWHRSIPRWAEERMRETRDWRLVGRHFASVMPRYGDRIRIWDVVNEPIADASEEAMLRASPLLDAYGPGYVARALETARVMAPDARLMINEYGLEHADRSGEVRRMRFLKLLDSLARDGAPLNGVGLQGHLEAHRPLRDRPLAGFLRELAARRLDVIVTELDVKEDNYALPVPRRDAVVGDLTRRFLDVALDQPAVGGVITWGLSDRCSWLDITPSDRARRPDAWKDGSTPGVNRGLPLDSDLRSKPMYNAIMDAFAAAPKRTSPPII